MFGDDPLDPKYQRKSSSIRNPGPHNKLVIEVADTGVGITKQSIKSLFKMFGKLQSTQQINSGGIGLGLFICKQITEQFNG